VLRTYGPVLAVAFFTTWVATFLWRAYACRRPALRVPPDDRRIHDRTTPTGGGAAMWLAFLAAMAVAWRSPQLREVFDASTEPLGIVLGATVLFAVGLLDDIRDVSPPAKLAGTVLGASIMASQGVQMLYFRVPFWDVVVLDQSTGFLITVVWVVLVTQAVNLIDGLDGLAAGVALIAGFAFFLYATRQVDAGLLRGNTIGPLLAVVVVGVCLGFLPHNFNPARVFMGDAGALFLGLLLATSTLVVGGRTGEEFTGQTFFFFAPVLIPFVILGVPLLDTAFAFLRRVVQRRGIAVADKEHLHHRLVRLGHGHRRAVLILWAWTAVLATLVLVPTYAQGANGLVLPGLLALGVILYTVLHPEVRAGRRPLAEPPPTTAPAGPVEVHKQA
jgi:UDP-GlcNAc:undecaprenyl-phosphate GlcNAc-1-phosphate transferase